MDITKCHGINCPQKNACYRFTAVANPYRQSYFSLSPLASNGDCIYFWLDEPQPIDTKEERVKMVADLFSFEREDNV